MQNLVAVDLAAMDAPSVGESSGGGKDRILSRDHHKILKIGEFLAKECLFVGFVWHRSGVVPVPRPHACSSPDLFKLMIMQVIWWRLKSKTTRVEATWQQKGLRTGVCFILPALQRTVHPVSEVRSALAPYESYWLLLWCQRLRCSIMSVGNGLQVGVRSVSCGVQVVSFASCPSCSTQRHENWRKHRFCVKVTVD